MYCLGITASSHPLHVIGSPSIVSYGLSPYFLSSCPGTGTLFVWSIHWTVNTLIAPYLLARSYCKAMHISVRDGLCSVLLLGMPLVVCLACFDIVFPHQCVFLACIGIDLRAVLWGIHRKLYWLMWVRGCVCVRRRCTRSATLLLKEMLEPSHTWVVSHTFLLQFIYIALCLCCTIVCTFLM